MRDDEAMINYDIHNAQDGDIIVRVRKIKNGSIGRTTMIVKSVVPYDPDTSYLQPNQLHCEWDPERKNVYIAYLHASYNSMGDALRTSVEQEIHAVVNDDSDSTKYRLAYDGEIDALTKLLAEEGLAWNPNTKSIVPLTDAREEESPLIEFSKEDDSMDEFEFVDVPKLNRSKSLSGDMVSVNIRNGGYRMTFNSNISKELKRNNFLMMRIARSKSGDICLIFSKNDGCPGRIGDNTYVVSSKTHVFKIRELLGITDDYDIIHIKQNSISTNYISYIIYK